jgi:hypothetical protein
MEVNIYENTSSWIEAPDCASVGSIYRPSSNNSVTIGTGIIGTTAGSGPVYEIDVDPQVIEDWSSGNTPNNGITLIGPVVATVFQGIEIFSDEAVDPNQRPQLIVTFCPSLTLSTSVTPASACGLADGSIDLTVTGGTAPYTYLWSNGITTQDLTNVVAGTYSVTVTDAAMNTATTTATVGGDTGNGVTFPTQSVANTAAGANSVYAIDVDGDGDMDLLSTSFSDRKVSWHENDGSQNFTERILTTSNRLPSSVYAIDVDGDGDVDVLYSDQGTRDIVWYENDGSQNFTERVIAANSETASSVYALDVDGDGDVDVLSAIASTSTIAWYENDGSQNFTEQVISSSAAFAQSVYALDVDGDGDVDVLSASFNDNKIAWYENDGSQNFTERVISTNAVRAQDVYAIDVDGDGDVDVLSGSESDDKVAWYENDGSQNFTERVISTNANDAESVYAIDVDGDGDVDVLSASGNDDKIAWYENDGSQNFTERVISTAADSAGDVYAVDVDGDGDVDALSASFFDGKTAWYENVTDCLSPLAAQIQAQTNVNCFGQNTGAVTVTTLGGLAPYEYALDAGSFGPSSTFTGLAAGSYTINVRDANLDVVPVPVVITQPTAGLSITPTLNQPSCFDFGSITLSVSGGTGPYTYNWADVPGSSNPRDRSGLAAGDYSVVVTDANGCTLSSGTLTLNAPANCAPLSICSNDPIRAFSVTPDPLNESYNWTVPAGAVIVSGQGTPEISVDWGSVAPGSYQVCVTAVNVCGESDPVCQDVGVLAAPMPTATANPVCEGDIIQLFATGGIEYAWSGPNGFTSFSANPIVLNANAALHNGTYTVTVTNSAGCEETASVGVTVGTPPTLSLVEAASACGGVNGAVDLTVSGGTPGYTFSWNNGATTEDQVNLPAGGYFVTVTDASGCTVTDGIAVSDNPAPTIAVVAQDVSCAGDMDGAADLTISSGISPFTTQWSTGATTEDITGLAAGNYSVTVIDDNGCRASATAMITEPAAINVDFTKVDIDCFGTSTGSIDLIVSGGTGSYTYSWSGPGGYSATTEDITGLAAGTYSVVIADANNCPATASIMINQPASGLSATPAVTDVRCFGDMDGQIILTVTDGTAPYTYSWSGPGGFTASTKDISGLAAGTYGVTVTDANGCTTDLGAGVSVGEPSALTIVGTLSVTSCDVTCNGANDGVIISQAAQGGTPPYSFAWSNGVIGGDGISGLSPGSYALTVTDANGCVATRSYIISEPPALVVTPTVTDVDCPGASTGSVTLAVSGGPYGNYFFSWSDGSTSQDLLSAPAGTYTVTVTDIFSGITECSQPNCSQVVSVTINEPDALTVGAVVSDALCNGDNTGEIQLNVNGGTAPYSYNWSGSGSGGELRTGLAAGTYNLTVTDALGCMATEAFVVNEPLALSLATVATGLQCNGDDNGSVDLTVSGGTGPYLFNWSNGETTEDISTLSGGTYEVTVTDGNGCTATASQVVDEPASIQIAASQTNIDCFGASTGSIDLTVSGGTPGYTYAWMDGSMAEDRTGLAAGTYRVTVTDANNCTSTAQVTVTQNNPIRISGTVANADCFGAATGSINLTVNGGNGTYTYVWSDGPSTAQNRTGLTAGIYGVTVTDGLSCTSQAAFVVGQPSEIVLAATATAPTCNGDNTGSIDLTVSGGLPGYTYAWSDGAVTTQDRTGLAAGTYTVTVTDNNNCTAELAITIDDPALFAVNITDVRDINCLGGNDGTARALTVNGNGPFTYLWSNGSTVQTPMDFVAGNYSVTVTDNNGCVAQAGPITINEPTVGIELSATTTPSFFCGLGTGSIDLTVTNGTAPFSYTWSGAGTISGQQDQTGLVPGLYTVNVTDALGCTAMLSVEVSSTLTVGNPVCEAGGGTYSVTFTETSGATITVGPGSYTINGNVVSGIPVGTDVEVTATNPNDPNCSITLTAMSPVDCSIACPDDLISVGSAECAPDFNTYSVSFVLAPGTALSVSPSVGIIGSNEIIGIPVGTDITLTASNTACGTMETIPVSAPLCCPDAPVASVGEVSCVDGSTYQYSFIASPGATAVSTSGLVSGNTVTVAVGTNDTLTVYNRVDCEAVVLFVNSPVDCNIACVQPDLTIGNSVCTDGETYSVSFTETTGAIISTGPAAYTVSGNMVIGIEVGEDVEITATNPNDPACSVTLVAESPDDCRENCPDELISVSGLGECAIDFSTYTVYYTLAPGATLTVSPMVGMVGTGEITGIPAGTDITLIATNAECNLVDEIVVPAPDCDCPVIDPPVSGGDAEYCAGGTIPTVTATVPMGQTVDWYDVPTGGTPLASGTESFTPTAPGTYYAEAVEVVSGCTSTTRTAVTVTEISAPTVNVVPTNPTDCEVADGRIVVTATGAANLKYSIDGGLSFSDNGLFIGLSPGTYDVVVMYGDDCMEDFGTVTLVGPDNPTVTNVSINNPDDCDSPTGVITITTDTPEGDTEYSIDGGQTWQASNTFNGLIAGFYEVFVRNNDGTCPAAGPVVALSEPIDPILLFVTTTDPTGCNGTNGEITAFGGGGEPPYQFRLTGPNGLVLGWSVPGTQFTFTGLAPGSYDVAIRNSDGTCEIEPLTVRLDGTTEPTIVGLRTERASCQSGGSATLFVDGGEVLDSYQYSTDGLNWTPAGGSFTFNDLGPGLRTLYVANADLSCPAIIDVTIESACLELEKTAVLTDTNNDGTIGVGDVINFSFEVTNTGTLPITSVNITDLQLPILNGFAGTLNPGESYAGASAQYTVTLADVIAGEYVNQAEASGQDPSNMEVTDLSDDPNDPADVDLEGDGEPDDPTVTVIPDNQPTANDDNITVCEGGSINADVLANDDFGGNGPATGAIGITSNGINGVATVDDNGTANDPTDDSINYMPNLGFTGTDVVSYEICDADGDCSTATLTIIVEDQLLAGADNSDEICAGTASYDLTALLSGADAGGEWDQTGGGSFISLSDPMDVDFSTALAGLYTFTYTHAASGSCSQDQAVLTVTVTSLEVSDVSLSDPTCPSKDDGSIVVTASTSGTQPIQYSIDNGATFQASNIFSGLMGGTYDVVVQLDGPLGCQASALQVVLNTPDCFPTADNDLANTDADTPVNIAVLLNDDFGGDGPSTGTITLITPPMNGTATVNNGGTPNDPTDDSIDYTPDNGFSGPDNLFYEICDVDGDCDDAEVIISVAPPPFVSMRPRVMLQGALLGTNDGLMRDDLRQAGDIPQLEPYTGLGFSHLAGGGGENVTNMGVITNDNGPNSIVDWVYVELRDANDPTVVLATRSGLLQRDGDIVEMDGTEGLSFSQITVGNYYVSVRHRNHLGVMTASPVDLSSSGVVVDFTSPALDVFNTAPIHDGIERADYNGVKALWAGNTSVDNKVVFAGQDNDKDPIFDGVDQAVGNAFNLQTFILSGYLTEDVNLDVEGIFAGQENDVDIIFNNIDGYPANFFKLQTYVIPEQLP